MKRPEKSWCHSERQRAPQRLWRGGIELGFGNGESAGLFRGRWVWSSFAVDVMGSAESILKINVLTKGKRELTRNQMKTVVIKGWRKDIL